MERQAFPKKRSSNIIKDGSLAILVIAEKEIRRFFRVRCNSSGLGIDQGKNSTSGISKKGISGLQNIGQYEKLRITHEEREKEEREFSWKDNTKLWMGLIHLVGRVKEKEGQPEFMEF